MGFDVQRFVVSYGIPHTEVDSGRRGWLNISCPFCPEGDTKFKLGLNPKGYTNCWRCGPHDLQGMICKLLGVKRQRADLIIAEFEGSGAFLKEDELVPPKTLALPGDKMKPHHRDYLAGRGFDPDWLELEYGLLGTSAREEWEGKFFGGRIIIPIYDRYDRLVSFQGRDITRESEMRYKGCPIALSPLHYKRTLYGQKFTKPGMVVPVEGIFDQWRLGRGSVCTFGTDITKHQLLLLSEWPQILFAYDSEPEAQGKAEKHARELAALGRSVEVVDLELGDRDLGDLSELEASRIRVELGLL